MFIYIYHMYVCIVSSFPKQKTIFGEKWYKRHFRKTFTHKNLKILQENSFWPRARREVLVVTLMTQKKKKKNFFFLNAWNRLKITRKFFWTYCRQFRGNLEKIYRQRGPSSHFDDSKKIKKKLLFFKCLK